jgi:DNA-binding MarR family transcriptional regulator
MAAAPDGVDGLVEQWLAVRPDLGDRLPAMATIARFGRVNHVARGLVDAALARHDLSVGEFDVLAALRRSGAPFVLRPIDLARTLMLSPAGMTGRLDRLEQAGWIARRLDPADRRSMLVELTEAGRTQIDAAVTDHVDNEERLLGGLTRTQRETLDDLLRRLLAHLESVSPGAAGGVGPTARRP